MSGYDVVIIGAGPGGYVAAIRAGQLGLKTALIEKRQTLGGTCLNIGCIPSKALLDSSEFYARTRNEAEEHGIEVSAVKIDLAKMMARKEKVVSKLTGGVKMLLKSSGVDVYHGTGWIVDAGKVELRDESGKAKETLNTKNLILANGSAPAELPFLQFDGEQVISSTEALSLEKVPRELLVVGAGAIGLEMASVWSRLGSQVTVVEIMPEILPGWDGQVAKTIRRELSKQGIDFQLETKVTGIRKNKKSLRLSGENKKGEEVSFSGEKVLVAVGRRPYLEGCNLEALSLAFEEDGKHIQVNDRFETGVDGVYAIGDIVHGPMLAHKAEDEGVAVAEILAGKPGHVNYEVIPNVVYTWPEGASVGRTEEQLKEAGVEYASGSFPFAANGRALAMDAPGGFVKILAEAETDRVLGMHVVGPWASDLIAEGAAVMEFGGSAEDMARTCHAHPTLPEAVKEAALAVAGRAIHTK
ncbi:MAG: dihydrolipoyl dehydrogenase [Alkalispirochaetaceae bacterium]